MEEETSGAASDPAPLLPAVKPDPPEGVRLRQAGQLLQVLWHPPASWPFPNIFSLKYRIRYRRHGASHFRQVRGGLGEGETGFPWTSSGLHLPPGALRSRDSAAGLHEFWGFKLTASTLPRFTPAPSTARSYPPPSPLSPQVGPIEATTFTFRAAKSHAKYCVQVSAQDLTDYGKPSDWSLPGQAEGTPQKSLKRD